MTSTWNLPRDKNYPPDAVQCDECGGTGGGLLKNPQGCPTCGSKGWLPNGHPKRRVCERVGCGKPIPPNQWALYCSNDCARRDSGWKNDD